MKKIGLAFLLLCGMANFAFAQRTLETKEMIGLTPVVPKALRLPEDARSSLNMKMNQMILRNGLGTVSGQFALTVDVVVADEQVTAAAQHMVKLELSLYVVDVLEQTVVAEQSFRLTGVDRTENRATVQAVNQFNPRGTQARAFMGVAREKILDYYTTRIPVLVEKANALAEQGCYEEAYAILASVPESMPEYSMVLDRKTVIYRKMIEKTSAVALQEARVKTAAGDIDGAVKALSGVDPQSRAAAGVAEVVEQIRSLAGTGYDTELKAVEEGTGTRASSVLTGDALVERTNAWYDRTLRQ